MALRTSGTSGRGGRPRRVVRTTASWVDSFAHVAGLTGLDASSRLWLPDAPEEGRGGTLALFAGVLARWVGAERVASPGDATHTHLTPGALERSLGRFAGVHATVAGDRLSPVLLARARETGVRVAHYYGAAELSFVAWAGDGADLAPFPEVEVDVRDGVVWVRSPWLAQGYADGDPPGALRTDATGFATVGDRGRWTGPDRLVVTGRGDDAVTTGGATVLVGDVEAALAPVVAGGLAVLGVPHEGLGQVLAAVLTDELDLAPAAAAAGHLDAPQRPRLWFLRDALPLSASGKTDRRLLRDEVASRSPRLRAVRAERTAVAERAR